MNEILYPMIFKRKSFHVFKECRNLSQKELEEIQQAFYSFVPLEKHIQVEIKIVPKNETTCKRGEYCILLFSEKKENDLKNIGYIGAQLDLWLANRNIGACWYGAGKIDKQYDTTLAFVIMLAIQKVPEDSFRKDMFRNKTELNIYKVIGTKRGIMPANKVEYYSEIDIGIFLCFLELCMGHEKISFHRKIFDNKNLLYGDKLLCAKYQNNFLEQ